MTRAIQTRGCCLSRRGLWPRLLERVRAVAGRLRARYRHIMWMVCCGHVKISWNPYRVWGFHSLVDSIERPTKTTWVINAGGVHICVEG